MNTITLTFEAPAGYSIVKSGYTIQGDLKPKHGLRISDPIEWIEATPGAYVENYPVVIRPDKPPTPTSIKDWVQEFHHGSMEWMNTADLLTAYGKELEAKHKLALKAKQDEIDKLISTGNELVAVIHKYGIDSNAEQKAVTAWANLYPDW